MFHSRAVEAHITRAANIMREARITFRLRNTSFVRLCRTRRGGTFDLDGSDLFEISKLLAGNTKPFLRLSGAPYWEITHNCGTRLPDIIELERMERSWYPGNDIEIVSEGDTYPRPRWQVPAAWLEIFDSALQVDGTLDGILKYLFDYSASSRYERAYPERHLENASLNADLRRIFAGKTAEGIRVWSPMKTVETADYSDKNVTVKYLNRRFYPIAPRSLASAALPTVYAGTGCAGIAFGEDARHLPPEAFSRPLILDLCAANILRTAGIDTGLIAAGELQIPRTVSYAPKDTDVLMYSGAACLAPVTVAESAVIRGTFDTGSGVYPFGYAYENAAGQRFLVFAFDADAADEELWRNYLYPALLHDTLEAWGCPLPFRLEGNPDVYAQCKTDGDSLAVGLWNCCADPLTNAELTLPDAWETAEFFGCSGRLDGSRATVSLPAYGYGAVLLRRRRGEAAQ